MIISQKGFFFNIKINKSDYISKTKNRTKIIIYAKNKRRVISNRPYKFGHFWRKLNFWGPKTPLLDARGSQKGHVPTRICRPPRPSPLSFYPIFMGDAECAETNEKSIFRFLFYELSWKFIENWVIFSTKMTITPKIKIGNI